MVSINLPYIRIRHGTGYQYLRVSSVLFSLFHGIFWCLSCTSDAPPAPSGPRWSRRRATSWNASGRAGRGRPPPVTAAPVMEKRGWEKQHKERWYWYDITMYTYHIYILQIYNSIFGTGWRSWRSWNSTYNVTYETCRFGELGEHKHLELGFYRPTAKQGPQQTPSRRLHEVLHLSFRFLRGLRFPQRETSSETEVTKENMHFWTSSIWFWNWKNWLIYLKMMVDGT